MAKRARFETLTADALYDAATHERPFVPELNALVISEATAYVVEFGELSGTLLEFAYEKPPRRLLCFPSPSYASKITTSSVIRGLSRPSELVGRSAACRNTNPS